MKSMLKKKINDAVVTGTVMKRILSYQIWPRLQAVVDLLIKCDTDYNKSNMQSRSHLDLAFEAGHKHVMY